MHRFVAAAASAAAVAAAIALPSHAAVQPFPAAFQARTVQTDGAVLHVVTGGHGPAVVLLHGFGDTGAMWSPLASRLAARHTVVVPDLRGMGLSSHPEGGYDKWTQAADIRAVLRQLGIDHAATDVTEVVIPDAGHWLMEEAPGATMAAVESFIDGNKKGPP